VTPSVHVQSEKRPRKSTASRSMPHASVLRTTRRNVNPPVALAKPVTPDLTVVPLL
jgi:hypothetical protein